MATVIFLQRDSMMLAHVRCQIAQFLTTDGARPPIGKITGGNIFLAPVNPLVVMAETVVSALRDHQTIRNGTLATWLQFS